MGLLDIIIVILVVAWLGGFSMKFAGSMIHFLLVLAIILFVVRLLS